MSRLYTIKLTASEVEAVDWAVGQVTCGDVDDAGGSPARYNAACRAIKKLPLVHVVRRDERDRRTITNFERPQ